MSKSKQELGQPTTKFLGNPGGRTNLPSAIKQETSVSTGKWIKLAKYVYADLGFEDITTEQKERLGSVLIVLSSKMHPERARKAVLELGNCAILPEIFDKAVSCLFKYHSDAEKMINLFTYLEDSAKKSRKSLELASDEMSTDAKSVEALKLVSDNE